MRSFALSAVVLWACARPVPPAPPVPAPPAHAAAEGPQLLDGTPEIPPELAERMRQYNNVRSANVADMGPDGSLLIRTRFAETTQLHRVAAPGAARHQLTFRDEPVRGATFTPDGGAVVYLSDVGGDEQYQLWRLDRATGRTTQLTQPGTRNSGPSFSHDGQRMAFTSNARNGKDSDVWLADGVTPDSRRLLTETQGLWWLTGWAPDDSALLAVEYISRNVSHLWTIDAETGETARLSAEDAGASHLSAAWGADPGTVYATSDRGGEFAQLYKVERASGDWTPLTPDLAWDVGGLTRAPDGSRLAFSTNEGGRSALYLLDPATDAISKVEALPQGVLRGMTFSDDGGTLALSLATATSPTDAWTLDVASGALTRWTESEVGGLDVGTFIEPTLVHYPSFDGLEIPAFWYDAPGEGPHPVVVFIHGGPEGQSRPSFSSLTQYLLLESGFSVVVPNVRGSAGYGKSWLKLDNAEKREDSVKDIGALLDWIAQEPSLDADRVAVSGGSYGGYMVLATLTLFPDRVRAGVDNVGIANFVTFLENTKEYRRDLRRVEYGDERDPQMRAHLTEISPVHRADRIEAALFVAHGANDPRVPVGEARQIVDAVRANGGEAWSFIALDEGHGFRKRDNRDLYRLLQVLFLEQHVRDAPADAPVDAPAPEPAP